MTIKHIFVSTLAILLLLAPLSLQSIKLRGTIPNAAITKNDVLSHELSTYFNLNEVKNPYTAFISSGGAYGPLEPFSVTPDYLGANSFFIFMEKVAPNVIVTVFDKSKVKVSFISNNKPTDDAVIELKSDKIDPLCTHAILERARDNIYISCIDNNSTSKNPGNLYIFTISLFTKLVTSINT